MSAVELPQRIKSGPLCALMRRRSLTMSGPRPSNGPHSRLSGRWVAMYFVAALRASDIDRTARRLRPEARPDIVGAPTPAKQQIEVLAMGREDCISASGAAIGCCLVAVGVIGVFARAANLDYAVRRDVFDDFEFSHCVFFNLFDFLKVVAFARGRRRTNEECSCCSVASLWLAELAYFDRRATGDYGLASPH